MTRHRSSPAAKASQRSKKRAQSILKSVISMQFFDQIISMNDLEEDALNKALLRYMEKKKVSAARKDGAAKRRYRQRKSWDTFQQNLVDQDSGITM